MFLKKYYINIDSVLRPSHRSVVRIAIELIDQRVCESRVPFLLNYLSMDLFNEINRN